MLTLSDHVRAREDDPHWWQDPRNAIRAVAAIERALSDVDPGRARRYAAGAAPTRRACSGSTARSPPASPRSRPAQRKLVTTHDALGYYARATGSR